ncbi:MAG: MBL fold metallo-hydrolase [Planctomycetota bacterium]|jgi:phosphoribosyl 1,2-cyclic phosphodiesterase
MTVSFQSVCSSSAGNCLGVWSDSTKLLIDCGLSSMKRTRAALSDLYGDPALIDAVLLTHTHSDHISYYPLRVLDDYGLDVHLHETCVDQLIGKHFKGYDFKHLTLRSYQQDAFSVGDFKIQPFEVAHNPYYPTFGYRLECEGKVIVIATDFLDWQGVLEYFLDADLIFVESNHDLELLRRYYNPNSRYHLPNPNAGQMLVNIRKKSQKAPQQVVLGHLSDQRNEPAIALAEVSRAFEEAQMAMDFNLDVAPLRQIAKVVSL